MIFEPLAMEITAEDFSEAAGRRSEGLHLGQILTELNQLRGNSYGEMNDQTRQSYFAMGFIWEQLIGMLFRDIELKRREGILIRPDEQFRDGIAMSPDAIDLSDYAIEEYKATYMSSLNPIDDAKFWIWIIQMKCYCYAVGARTARLRVWFIAGDWRGSGPQVKAWTFHFSDRDCEEAWEMVLNMARSKGWLE